jgi:hypothetical protein
MNDARDDESDARAGMLIPHDKVKVKNEKADEAKRGEKRVSRSMGMGKALTTNYPGTPSTFSFNSHIHSVDGS